MEKESSRSNKPNLNRPNRMMSESSNELNDGGGNNIGVGYNSPPAKLSVQERPRNRHNSNSQMTSETLDAILVKLENETGYHIAQENGQRRMGPPQDWTGPPPPRGSEVFVGKLPRDCYENELFPAFVKVGRVYDIRLMMDFSGANRGFAFVQFASPQEAKTAIREMDGYQIRPGKYLGVVKSVDNNRLFVGGIPKERSREEIREEMAKVTEGVVDVIVYNSTRDKSKNRGFAFVEYETHRAAAIARRKLIPGRIYIWGQLVLVDWARPEPEVDDNIMAKVKVLYVRNLSENTTENEIRDVFDLGGNGGVEKVKQIRDFAFVHYTHREDAEDAMRALNGMQLHGSKIEVTFAKPPDKLIKQRGSARLGPPHGMDWTGVPRGVLSPTSTTTMQYTSVVDYATLDDAPSPGRGRSYYANLHRLMKNSNLLKPTAVADLGMIGGEIGSVQTPNMWMMGRALGASGMGHPSRSAATQRGGRHGDAANRMSQLQYRVLDFIPAAGGHLHFLPAPCPMTIRSHKLPSQALLNQSNGPFMQSASFDTRTANDSVPLASQPMLCPASPRGFVTGCEMTTAYYTDVPNGYSVPGGRGGGPAFH